MSAEKPKLYVSATDKKREEDELQGLNLELASWEANHPLYRALQGTLATLNQTLANSVKESNVLWDRNRGLRRQIEYVSAAEKAWRTRSENLQRTAGARYLDSLTADRIRRTRIEPRLAEQDRVIEQIVRHRSQQDQIRAQISDVKAQLKDLENEIRDLQIQIRDLEDTISRKVVVAYEHTVLTANVETEDEGTVLVISITLDYDALIAKRDEYRRLATAKIYRWFIAKFENVSAEPSIEVTETPKETLEALMKEKSDATKIHYSWYWRRTGLRSSPGESDEGDIDWTDEIPTISEADPWGWRTHTGPRNPFGRFGKSEGQATLS